MNNKSLIQKDYRTWVKNGLQQVSHANQEMASFISVSTGKTDRGIMIWFHFKDKRKKLAKKKKKKNKPSLFQEAGEEVSHSLLFPASESSKHCFILFVRMFFFWVSSCCLSRSSWIWTFTACSSLDTESNSSVRAIGGRKDTMTRQLNTILFSLLIFGYSSPTKSQINLQEFSRVVKNICFGVTQT